MKNETYGVIHFAIRDLLEARKSYPEMYTDDKLLIMALNVAACEEPEAPVLEVYNAIRDELVRGLAAVTPSPALRATSPSGGGSGAEHGEE